ncbi:hypothetical protein PCANB_000403 [Pneumocystis canis]|nr:hypothetical protein PCK1_000437 [Pneumocystis canis]KAG5438056.1 hypothetical protein PCANB_000403 [Pneumocystis canis]
MNNSGDDLISIIKSYTDTTQIQNVLLPYLKHLPNNVLTKTVPQDPLKTLDPKDYSIGYLYILLARKHVSEFNSIWEYCALFLSVFDISLITTMALIELKQLLKWICNNANAMHKSFLAINILRLTLKRYPNFTTTLTPIHTIFVQQCFTAKAYTEVQFLLNSDMEVFDKNNGITYIDHLLYHFYRALINIKLKFFDKALDFFKIVISAPTINTSAIQVNAYKKFVILSLVVNGKIESLPHITDAVSIKTYKIFGKPYEVFAEVYESQDHEKIKDVYFKYRDFFIKDKNNELIKYAVKFLPYHEIYRFREIYTCISIVDINKKIGPWNGISLESQDSYDLTEKFILKMIEERKLNAVITIYESQKVVNFINTTYDKKIQKETLKTEINNISTLITKLSTLNQSYDLTKTYLAIQSNLSTQSIFHNDNANSEEDIINSEHFF